MDAAREKLMAGIRQVAETFVRQYYKDEERFFPIVWAAFDGGLKKIRTPESVEFVSEALLAEIRVGLGFAQEAAMDLVTPRVLAATYAAAFDVTLMSEEAGPGYVGKVVRKYGERFKVPAEFLPTLEDFLSKLLKEEEERVELVSLGGPSHNELVLLRWDEPFRAGSQGELAAEIDKTRAEKRELDLFLDDLRNEFLVKGAPRSLQALQRRLFVCLLMRVGEYWEYAELFYRIWGDEAESVNNFHQLLYKLHGTTDHVLKDFIELPSNLERCYIHNELRRNTKYAVVFVAGTY